jgi:glycosyltransferase involved in cell wall biosynthesis
MKLSIITINYNNAAGLKKTIDSVALQTYTDFEHIIVDGASTDGSVDEIFAYSQSPIANRHKITWISEPDTGIYNAMNKGVRLARGEYTLMLNSGDYLVNNSVVEKVMPLLDGTDIIQGNIIEEYPDKVIRNRGYGKSDIDFFDVMNGHFLHQASFIHIDTLKKYGYYDESYKKGADTYFYITTLALGHASFKYVDVDVANFDVNGISNMQDPKWVQIDKEEDARWYGEHISMRLMSLCRTAPKKVRLYDMLHRHKLIWYITMILVRLSLWITHMPQKVKLEKIK